jgi:glutaconate CoA-transferase subunit A
VVEDSKLTTLEQAVELVEDGALLGVGGVLLRRKPIAFLAALAASGRRDLRVASFLSSLDVDLLVAHGAVAEVHAGYVGFEQLGFAPAFGKAVAAGEVRALEYSELLFVSGLRAALAGLPFLPTRGAMGSDIVPELGVQEITCPYTGERLLAAPALRPHVAVIHAEAADERGNVLSPSTKDFLFDSDANVARAADAVVVTAERIVSTDEIRSGGALLFSYEVTAVVEAPRGAWPTALPGVYGADLEAVRAYIAQAESDPAAAAAALAGARV